MNKRKKVAIIFGGCSPEYKVSLASAYSVICHMDKTRYIPILIGISSKGDWYIFEGKTEKISLDTWCNAEDCIPIAILPDRVKHNLLLLKKDTMEEIHIDVVFPILHGKNGEDGTVQGLFELLDIPVAGCGILSSALCMDKYRAHKLISAMGILVPESVVIDRETDAKQIGIQAGKMGYPLFVKPVKAGSSYGVAKVLNFEELVPAIENAFCFDDKVIIEENISGFEVGCAILGNDKLVLGEIDEIELSDGFFNYEEKYSLKTSSIHVPARVSKKIADKIKNVASKIYKALDCRGFARVDLFLSNSGEIVFNEVNTIPGFTSHSRFPNMLKAAGMTLEEIISIVIDSA